MWVSLFSSIFGSLFKELLALWTMEEIVEYKEATDVVLPIDEKTVLDEHSWILTNKL